MPLIQWTAASSRWTAAKDLFWATNIVFSQSLLFLFSVGSWKYFLWPIWVRICKKNMWRMTALKSHKGGLLAISQPTSIHHSWRPPVQKVVVDSQELHAHTP